MGKRASNALAYEHEIYQQRCKGRTSFEHLFKSSRLLVAQYPHVGGTMSDVTVIFAMLGTFND